MTLSPNTPITQENVGLLKAGDWLRHERGPIGQLARVTSSHIYMSRKGLPDIGDRHPGFTYIGPDLGDGWIGWSGRECPVDGEASIEWQQRWVKGVYSGPAKVAPWQVVSAFRPALSPPAERSDPFAEGLRQFIDTFPRVNARTPAPAEGEVDGPEIIWLEPSCCANLLNGRMWAEDDLFPACEDGKRPTKYIRADQATPTPAPVDWTVVGPKLVEALKRAVADALGDNWKPDALAALAAAQQGAK